LIQAWASSGNIFVILGFFSKKYEKGGYDEVVHRLMYLVSQSME